MPKKNIVFLIPFKRGEDGTILQYEITQRPIDARTRFYKENKQFCIYTLDDLRAMPYALSFIRRECVTLYGLKRLLFAPDFDTAQKFQQYLIENKGEQYR